MRLSLGGVSLAFVALCISQPILADVKLPPVLSSHMVLQRGIAVPIWGTAAPGEKVTVAFCGQKKTTDADAHGKWSLKLDPLEPGGPFSMKISGANAIDLADILVGEVWVGSGQSNMQGSVGSYAKNDEPLAKAAAQTYPKLRLMRSGGKEWQTATPENIQSFSAILFGFGQRLQTELNVPVGLMVGAVGGTPSGNWLSEEAYRSDEACKAVAAKAAANYSAEKENAKYQKALADWEKATEAAKAKNARPPRKPDAPQPPGECTRGKVGNLFEAHIRPFMPYAIRGVLWDQGESGTAIVGVDQYTLMGALIRGWRKEWGQGDFPFLYIQKPSGGGPAWDPNDPITCRADKFAPLPAKAPDLNAGAYRELHLRIRQYPQTAMVTASDLGAGVHPTNKSGYSARAARVALGFVYGQPVAIYGPTYKSHKIEGNRFVVQFDNVGKGLAFRQGNKLQGFAVAGADKVFHWADAKIYGDRITLTCPAVSQPKYAQYAWGATHPWANLFNQDGLPALPFCTAE